MEIKTIDDLKKAYPDLCEQLVQAAVSQKEKEVKESMQKDFDARILKEVEGKTEEVKKAVIEEIKNSEEYKGMAGTLVEIAKLVKPYLPEGTSEDDNDELEERIEELSGKVSTLEAEKNALKEQIDNDKKAAEAKIAVGKKITELTAGKEHEGLLVERLQSCKTVEEVEARFKAETEFINKIKPAATTTGKGTGQVLDENKQDQITDAEKQRQRQLAGVDDDVARQKHANT